MCVAGCIVRSGLMLGRAQLHLSGDHIGDVVRFGDGTAARVYRETTAELVPVEPCFLWCRSGSAGFAADSGTHSSGPTAARLAGAGVGDRAVAP
jgi:hypothetical protein